MSNLTVDGTSNYHATGTPDTYTAVSDGPSGSEGLASHINGIAEAVRQVQLLLGNALTLKGSVADLVTRLSRVIAADGALAKGTSFPGTPVDGQPLYRTDLNTLYIYDAGTTSWTVALDSGVFALADGSRNFTGDVTMKKSVPSVRMIGQEVGAADYKMGENGGVLTTWKNTGTEAIPVWSEDNFFVPSGAEFLFGGTIAPNGYLEENGQAVNRTTYARLFTIFGTTHGAGDGSTTFNLPDYRDRVPLPAGASYDKTFTISAVNTGTEELTVTSNKSLYTGVPVTYDQSGGSDIGGLTDLSTYYIIRVSATVVKLATSKANAFLGVAINLTSAGTGTHVLRASYSARIRGEFGGAEDAVSTHRHTVTDPGHTHGLLAGSDGAGVQPAPQITPNDDTDGLGNTGLPDGNVQSKATGLTVNDAGDTTGLNFPPFTVTGMWIVKT